MSIEGDAEEDMIEEEEDNSDDGTAKQLEMLSDEDIEAHLGR